MEYYENHQRYIAEVMQWLDGNTRLDSLKVIRRIASCNKESGEQKRMYIDVLINDLLLPVTNNHVMRREGYFRDNICN